ncbi:50S ribosomal protein L33 [Streptomyces caniferus]|uniref:50S ribosomal protein L33 n=1 Tax=Streptomyces caniferus TaxID=285557 RepID=UPI0038075906
MARNELRPVVRLRSSVGTVPPALGFARAGEAPVAHVTRKNRRNDPDRLELRTFDPVAGRRVTFREER